MHIDLNVSSFVVHVALRVCQAPHVYKINGHLSQFKITLTIQIFTNYCNQNKAAGLLFFNQQHGPVFNLHSELKQFCYDGEEEHTIGKKRYQ